MKNAASFRSSKWFKPALLAGGLLVLLALGLLVVPLLIDINTYRGTIISQLEQTLGRKVNLGKLSLRVLPSVKVGVDQLTIGDDPQIAQGEFIQAKSVRLHMGLWSLLRGNPQVSGIELIEPQVTLIKTAGGDKWNWSTLKPLQSNEQSAEQPPFDLLVQNGSFKLIDQNVTPPSEKTFTGVNISLDDFSSKRAFDFVLGLTMPGAQAGKLEIAGEAGPLNASDAAQTPLAARVKMESVDVTSLEALLGVQSPRAGRLTTDITIKGKLAEGVQAAGDFKAEQFRLIAGVEPSKTPLTAKFKLNAKAEKKTPEQTETALTLEQFEVSLGKTSAQITGQITRLPAQPTFDLQLKGDRMALDSLLESAYAFGFGPPAGTTASGAATINLRATGEAAALALNGQAEIRDLKFQSAQLPQAIQISELKLNCTPQEITAAPFRATLSRTTVEFNNLKLTNYTQQGRAHLDIATNNAQVDDLLKIAESFGARPDATGSGTASLRAAIDTNLGAQSGGTTISGQGKVSNARLQPSQVNKPLEIANADLNFTGDSLRVDNLAARLGSSDASGWLQVKNFDQPAITFDARSNQLHVAELQGAMAAGQSAKGGKSSASAMRADGQLSVGKLLLDGLTASDMTAKLTLQNQLLTLDPLKLNMYGGTYQGSLRLNQAQTPAAMTLNGRFNGLDINQFLSASGKKSVLYGTADGALNVQGTTGEAQEALARSLVGNGNISISNGKFTSFDLMKQVEVLGKLTNLPTGGAGTAFRSLKTNLRFDKGRMTTDALQIVMDELNVTGDGWLQLGDAPTMDYGILARLSSALTKRVLPPGGGEGGKSVLPIGGAFGSVLGNFFTEKDSLVIPLRISGALGQPSFGLNSAMLQQRAKEQLRDNVRDSLVDKFLKPKDAQKTTDQNSPGQQTEPKKDEPKKETKPADLLKGVLDKFKKKEKPQP
ncbi:MAG: AsmA family protein [Acidobacteria bacterium]|nr:AsmA family protein [Acidobacteriota bacterium]